jgi:hypothetical protein
MDSTLGTLKSIITLLAGLTITNSSIILLTGSSFSEVVDIKNLPFQSVLLYFLIIINIVRFYHGNSKHIDIEVVSKHEVRKIGGLKLAADFFSILLQSVIFSIMSFYLNNPGTFFIIFTVLLWVDILWYITTNNFADKTQYDHQKKWTINNLVVAILLVIFLFILDIDTDSLLFFILAYSAILLNTVIDYIISWKYYFPTIN